MFDSLAHCLLTLPLHCKYFCSRPNHFTGCELNDSTIYLSIELQCGVKFHNFSHAVYVLCDRRRLITNIKYPYYTSVVLIGDYFNVDLNTLENIYTDLVT